MPPLRWTRPRIAAVALVLLLLAAGASLFFWRKATPPLVARLLPESQAIAYFDLAPLRAATHFNRTPSAHAPEYQRFIDQTGIDPERDLDEAAFALDRLPDLLGPNAGLAYSEVFRGRFDAARLASFLAREAAASEAYGAATIYLLPVDGRIVRVAVLPRGLVAVSNTPTPEQIHSILDRARASRLLFGGAGPTLLAEHYRDLPVLSLAWGLGQIGLPFGDGGKLSLFGLALPLRFDATFVASLRWTGALRLRVEEIAPNRTAAEASAGALTALLNVVKVAENNLPASFTDPNTQAILNSARVVQYDDRAVVTATLPTTLLRSAVRVPTR